MTENKLKIWSNVKYHVAAIELLREQTIGHELYLASESDFSVAEADVAFGQPDINSVKQSNKLSWIHLDSAGYEKFDNEDVRAALRARGAILTNSSEVYNEPCAQHLLAMMMSLARRIPHAFASQLKDHFWPMDELRADSYLLTGQTALLLGFGSIGKRLSELLVPLRMNLIAVRREPTGKEPIRVITENELEKYLSLADHILCTLPANPNTRHFINDTRLGQMKRGAIFYNIGRGSTVDQEALLDRLRSGYLAAAYLDVTDPEPLGVGHPMWTAPNCFITPHTAGGFIGEKEQLVRHFVENLGRFRSGSELIGRVI